MSANMNTHKAPYNLDEIQWLTTLSTSQQLFWKWMLDSAGLAHNTAREYVNYVRECNVYVQKLLGIEIDFYELEDSTQVARLKELLYNNQEFKLHSACLPILRSSLNKYAQYRAAGVADRETAAVDKIKIDRKKEQYIVVSKTPRKMNPARCWHNIDVHKLERAANFGAVYIFSYKINGEVYTYSYPARELQEIFQKEKVRIKQNVNNDAWDFFGDFRKGELYKNISQYDTEMIVRLRPVVD